MELLGLGMLAVGIFLITQRWFWVLGFGLCALAAWFTVLAMIFHFQILGALGMFILASILSGVAAAIAEE